jgi:hypothetical protein
MSSNKLKKLMFIYDGWGNLIFPSPEVEKLAKTRADICASCDDNKNNICGKCGCYIPAKCRAREDKCPVNKW